MKSWLAGMALVLSGNIAAVESLAVGSKLFTESVVLGEIARLTAPADPYNRL